MNIFALNESPHQSAWEMCDKHIVKMPVETAQMLSTIHRMIDGEPYTDYSKTGRRIQRWRHHTDTSDGGFLYRTTMMNHPCTVWARKTLGNYMWLADHGIALCMEYTKRYGRRHGSRSVIEWCVDNHPKNLIRDLSITPFAQAMPDKYKVNNDAVSAYRNYYNGEKSRFAKWKNGRIPSWFQGSLS